MCRVDKKLGVPYHQYVDKTFNHNLPDGNFTLLAPQPLILSKNTMATKHHNTQQHSEWTDIVQDMGHVVSHNFFIQTTQ